MNKIQYLDCVGNILDKEPTVVTGKIIGDGNTKKFLIKINQEGQPYQPLDGFYINRSVALSIKRGCTPYKFISVNYNTFQYYQMFLETSDTKFLKEVVRTLC